MLGCGGSPIRLIVATVDLADLGRLPFSLIHPAISYYRDKKNLIETLSQRTHDSRESPKPPFVPSSLVQSFDLHNPGKRLKLLGTWHRVFMVLTFGYDSAGHAGDTKLLQPSTVFSFASLS